MKVTDDAEKIYILITADTLGDNIQVLMDTDNQSVTGLDLSAQIATEDWNVNYILPNATLPN